MAQQIKARQTEEQPQSVPVQEQRQKEEVAAPDLRQLLEKAKQEKRFTEGDEWDVKGKANKAARNILPDSPMKTQERKFEEVPVVKPDEEILSNWDEESMMDDDHPCQISY